MIHDFAGQARELGTADPNNLPGWQEVEQERFGAAKEFIIARGVRPDWSRPGVPNPYNRFRAIVDEGGGDVLGFLDDELFAAFGGGFIDNFTESPDSRRGGSFAPTDAGVPALEPIWWRTRSRYLRTIGRHPEFPHMVNTRHPHAARRSDGAYLDFNSSAQRNMAHWMMRYGCDLYFEADVFAYPPNDERTAIINALSAWALGGADVCIGGTVTPHAGWKQLYNDVSMNGTHPNVFGTQALRDAMEPKQA